MSEHMTEPTSTSFIFVDRRKTGHGRSLNNRQKLLRRIRDSIKNSKPEDIDANGIAGSGTPNKTLNNPVRVARTALSEPVFHYAPYVGEREVVLIGNDRFLKGDDFPLADEFSSSSSAGPGEDSEDDFIVNISRSEFFAVFFEDCELPDLFDNHERVLPQATLKPAGFQRSGNPGQLSVIRSYKNSLGRRLAITRDERDELEELEKEKDAIDASFKDIYWVDPFGAAGQRLCDIEDRIEVLKTKINSASVFEDVDLRFRKSEKVQVKSADAVFIMIMDVSGSMDEEKKRMARKFFSLQYAFIKSKYPQTDLVFIAHTENPYELSEEEFFTTRLSGGTVVSPALELAHKIIKERYDARQSNIYLSYASDGDNWEEDNEMVKEEIESNGLLSKLRHMVYAQVGQSFAAGFGFSGGSTLQGVMKQISGNSKKLSTTTIFDENEVFHAFKTVYKKRAKL